MALLVFIFAVSLTRAPRAPLSGGGVAGAGLLPEVILVFRITAAFAGVRPGATAGGRGGAGAPLTPRARCAVASAGPFTGAFAAARFLGTALACYFPGASVLRRSSQRRTRRIALV